MRELGSFAVLGGGPAAGAAALALARGGAAVTLYLPERPGEKPCGGAVPEHVLPRLAGFDPSALPAVASPPLRLEDGAGSGGDSALDGGRIFRRRDPGGALVAAAPAAGARAEPPRGAPSAAPAPAAGRRRGRAGGSADPRRHPLRHAVGTLGRRVPARRYSLALSAAPGGRARRRDGACRPGPRPVLHRSGGTLDAAGGTNPPRRAPGALRPARLPPALRHPQKAPAAGGAAPLSRRRYPAGPQA